MAIHDWPYVQRILYEFNFNAMEGTKYEETMYAADHYQERLANTQTDMNVLVEYDPTQYP